MTVIAWDGHKLAADKRATTEDGLIRTVTKITEVVWRHGDGNEVCFLVGVAGDGGVGMELLSWFQDGADPEAFPMKADEGNATLVAISQEFGVQTWVSSPVPIYFEDDQLAWGTGRDFAIAAMNLGMDAIAAVDFACQHNAFCGGGIDVLTLVPDPISKTVH